jgi:hypothetical protein
VALPDRSWSSFPQGSLASRAVRRAAREIVPEVAIAGLMIEGLHHLAEHTADRVVWLDQFRERIASNEVMNALLVQIESDFVASASGIARKVFNPWAV